MSVGAVGVSLTQNAATVGSRIVVCPNQGSVQNLKRASIEPLLVA